jgi:hypothetical protein
MQSAAAAALVLLLIALSARAFEPEDLQALVFTDSRTAHRYKRIPAVLACMADEVDRRVRELNPMSYNEVLSALSTGEVARRAYIGKMAKWVPPVRLLSKTVPVFFPAEGKEPAVIEAVYRTLARFSAAATRDLQDAIDGYAFASETDQYVELCVQMVPEWYDGCRECAHDSHGFALRTSADPVKQPVVTYCVEVVPGSEEVCATHEDHSVLRCGRSRACRVRPGTGDLQCICV